MYEQSDSLQRTVASLETAVRDLTRLLRTSFANPPRGVPTTTRTPASVNETEEQGNLADSEDDTRRATPRTRRRRGRHHSPVPRPKEKNSFFVSLSFFKDDI